MIFGTLIFQKGRKGEAAEIQSHGWMLGRFSSHPKKKMPRTHANKSAPLILFVAADGEEGSFPALFAGSKRLAPRGVFYHEICRWELLNVDRRFA